MAGERILIVDDSPANVVLVSFLLGTKGYDVRTASHATEALAILGAFKPQLILMDVQLPGLDGLELTRRLKADPATRSIVIVVLTAHAMKADELRSREAGCDGYLSKPIDTRTLPGVIAGYLGQAASAPGDDDGEAAPPSAPAPAHAHALPFPETRGEPAPQQTRAGAGEESDGERAVVLVVDDQAPNRSLIRAHLGTRYLVRDATDAASALDILKHEHVDLLLLDVMMPHMSGFALCRLIKQSPDEHYLPVILLTALGQPEDRITGLAAGADDFLTKPVNKEELLLRVQAFVRLRQQDVRIRRHLVELNERDRIIRGQLEELQALDTLKDELVSLLVHDMRNPLGGIVGFLGSLDSEPEGLGRRTASGPQQLENLRADARTALAASGRLRETLDDILQVRLLESGTIRMHREKVEANALIRDAIASVHGAALVRHIEIEPQPNPSEVQLVVDRRLMSRAIENLLNNAVKHSPAGGTISAAVRSNGAEIDFEVADRGAGIPDDMKHQLFQKFGSVEAARAGGRRGSGLGLYLVKLVANAHGGRASVRDREGGGVTMRISLPLHHSTSTIAAPDSAPRSP